MYDGDMLIQGDLLVGRFVNDRLAGTVMALIHR